MRCEDVQEQLELLAYGELPAEVSGPMREHVLQCAVCRAQFELLQRAQGQLDAWQPAKPNVPVGELIDAMERAETPSVVTTIAAAQAVQKRRRFLPWMMGAAAGLALAIGVLALGAQVKSDDGQLVISFGRAAEKVSNGNEIQSASAELTDAQLVELSKLLSEQVDDRTIGTLHLVGEQFRELKGEQDKRFLALVNTIRAMREEDIERYEQGLKFLAADTARSTQQTRAALNDMARTVAMRPTDVMNFDGSIGPGRKEIVP